MKDITIRNLSCETPAGSLLTHQTGIILTGEEAADSTHSIENVLIEDVSITVEGKGRVESVRPVPERSLNNNYPEFSLFFPKSDSENLWPAYGIYARHVQGITFSGVEINTRHPDSRPFVQLEDAQEITLDVKTNEGNGPFLVEEGCGTTKEA